MSQNASLLFYDAVRHTLDAVEASQGAAIRQAAQATAECLVKGGMIHVFGTGHSHMLAEEIFFRAGGLVQVNAILDPGLMLHVSASGSTHLERLEGYAAIVLERYTLKAGDVMVVVSNSGRNAVPIEAALYAKARGLTVIGLTSASSYKATHSRHSSGKHLYEVVDIVLDTCAPEGDAAIALPGLPQPMGALSTVIGATLLQAYLCETAGEILNRGHQPIVLVSANVDGEQDHVALFAEYAAHIRHR